MLKVDATVGVVNGVGAGVEICVAICVATGVDDVESLNPLGETGLLLTVIGAELCCVFCVVELGLIAVASGVGVNPCAN